MMSLRGLLVRTLLSVLLPVWAVTGGVSYLSAAHEVDEIYDQQLQELALPLLPLDLPALQRAMAALHAPVAGRDADGDPELAVLVWRDAGELVWRSPAAPALSWADRRGQDAAAGPATVSLDGQRWRVQWFRQAGAGPWLAVLMPLHERDELATAMAIGLATPILLAGLLLWPVVAWAVWRGLRPLASLGREVARRQGRDLSRIDGAQVPQELQPLLAELNALLARLDDALGREKRFTADASHELRTPLAAAQVQIEVAQGALDPDTRSRALDKARLGLVRAGHLTEQLLTLSRLDHQWGLLTLGGDAIPGWQTDLALGALLHEVVADLSLEALAKGIELSLSLPEAPCLLPGQPVWMAMALRNVLGNAIKHTPQGGQIEVALALTPQAAQVSVCDSGPGLSEAQCARLGERFYRLDPTQPGAGLGLSIVARVMAIHQGSWQARPRPGSGGLCVTLTWPCSGAAPVPAAPLKP